MARTPKRWDELSPDSRLIEALSAADDRGARSSALAAKSTAPKTQWSSRFAGHCARMIAAEVRRHHAFRHLTVLPDSTGATEPPTFISGRKRKKVDVVASSLVSGLQVGISLKGMNFRDRQNLNFDKNLTGRTYELQDEIRVIHRHQPAAFLVALYFLPLAGTVDKKSTRSASSFAHVVSHLRSRTGRVDPMLSSQIDRADMSAVALYVPGDVESFRRLDSRTTFTYSDELSRGVIRYFDVHTDPPRRGRPVIESTLDLKGFVELVARRYEGAEADAAITWSEPESE